jgi:hypothetical protein
MLARDYVIILIIFSLVAGLGAVIVNDMNSSDNGYSTINVTNANFDSTYNRLSNISTDLVTQSSNETKSGFGKLVSNTEIFFGSTLVIFGLIFDSFSMVNNVFASFITDFGIPVQVANLIFPAIIMIITTIIIFVVISSWTKTKV